MRNDKESPFSLHLAATGEQWPVTRFKGGEGLNQVYRFEIQLIGPALDIDALLHSEAYLRLGEHHGIHGLLASVSLEYRHPRQQVCHLVLMPRLQQLHTPRKRRALSAMTVPQILQHLLETNGLSEDHYRIELDEARYPLRPFCIQYEESDLQLLQRLCEEEGIHYHFSHRPDGHVLVLADDAMNFDPQPLTTPFHCGTAQPQTGPVIWALYQRHGQPLDRLPPFCHDPAPFQDDEHAANQRLSDARPSILRDTQDHLRQRSRRHLERLRAGQSRVCGHSTRCELLSSRIVQVEQHPLARFNDQWLLIETQHQFQQTSTTSVYRNQFTAILWSTPFRPPLKQPRPSIPGYQRARVWGVEGQPAVLDRQGRLPVCLWPDDPDAEDTDLWLPMALTVAQAFANRLPLAGSEVLVSFLDHDPDRPLICGLLDPQRDSPPTRPAPIDTRLLFDWLLHDPDINL